MTADDNKVAGDNSVGQQRVKALREGGYETSQLTRASFARIRRYSRGWRKLHALLLLKPADTLFEFGCGGERQRAESLGGYHVPEIDYDKQKAAEEILEVGAINPQVYPLNIFWHLTMDSKLSRSKALLHKSAYYAGQFLPLPASNFAFRHAG